MNGDENPYRFTGGEPAPSPPGAADARQLGQNELRAIDVGRRILAALTLFAAVSLPATLAPAAILALGRLPPEGLVAFAVAAVVSALAHFGLFLAGLQLTPHLQRRHGAFLALGLLLPFVNLPIAIVVLRDATQTLTDRGVRPGWLQSDFRAAEREWGKES